MISFFTSLASRLPRVAAILAMTSALIAGPAIADGVKPLVSPAWLKTQLGAAHIVVLDIRSALDGGGGEAFIRGHIPGAVHSDYDKGGWRVTRNGVPFMLPTLAELEKLIGELGIDEDIHVVVTPAGVHALDFGAAARVYWTLKAVGIAKVSILDGGYAAWTSDPANQIATGPSKPSPRIFTAALNKNMVADSAEVEQIARVGGATLLDARPISFFLGKERAPAAKAYGHIPGAINIEHAAFYDHAANRLKPPAELTGIAASIPAGPVVSYCNTGHWAATNWFVLSEILGRKDVKLYYGSMVEWTADANRPVASTRTKWDDLKKTLGLGS